jgi:hypothetical protein
MPAKPPADSEQPRASVPPIEPVPFVAPVAPVPPPPAPPAPPPPATAVDPYAQVAPPPPPSYAPAGYAPGAYPQAYQSGYYGAPQPPRGLAIASLITGIIGAFFSLIYGVGFLPSLAAVITGHLASKRQPYARGMWLAGLICGYVGLAISVLWIVGIIIFVAFVTANPAYFDTGGTGLN